MPKTIVGPQIIQNGTYSTTVPFYNSLFVADHILTSNDVLIPLGTAGTPAHLRPILGAKTYYKLTGDGSHVPTFGASFIKTTESFRYNPANGVINLIEFVYDGTNFTYTILPETLGYEFPRFVGNYGLGDSLITANTVSGVAIKCLPAGLGGIAHISAYNLLTAVHYTGQDMLVYGLSKDKIVWVENIDAKAAQLAYNSTEVGNQTAYVRVRELVGPLVSTAVALTVNVTTVPL